jgi:hypothetical protein
LVRFPMLLMILSSSFASSKVQNDSGAPCGS